MAVNTEGSLPDPAATPSPARRLSSTVTIFSQLPVDAAALTAAAAGALAAGASAACKREESVDVFSQTSYRATAYPHSALCGGRIRRLFPASSAAAVDGLPLPAFAAAAPAAPAAALQQSHFPYQGASVGAADNGCFTSASKRSWRIAADSTIPAPRLRLTLYVANTSRVAAAAPAFPPTGEQQQQQSAATYLWDCETFSATAVTEHVGSSHAVAAAGGVGGGGGGSAATSTGNLSFPAAGSAGASDGGSPPGGKDAPAAGGRSSSSGVQQQQRGVTEILDYAAGQAFKGGIAGASAQVLNVFCFMWLRTTMNYQYRYGGSTIGAVKKLYAEGGVVRFYRGLLPALMQSPLSRFGDTAANVGVLAALDAQAATRDLPVGVKTALASCGAAAWRFFLMPIDAWKTTKQVEGGSGLHILANKVRHHGVSKLYHGSVAAMGATWVGHYPWFFVHNYMSAKLPQFDNVPQGKHVRYGFIGFVSSIVSDTCSNSIRVLKTTKQTSVEPMTYPQALREVLTKDGVTGLFFRGLGTRILTNGLQGMVFSVGWKAIQSQLSK